MHRFWVPPACLQADPVCLPGPAAHQIRRVLRLAAGDRIVLFCGDGLEHEAILVDCAGAAVSARVEKSRRPGTELPCALEVGVALLKGEKFDWVIQKLVELGATTLVALQAERCVPAVRADRWPARLERYSAIAREAAEQSGRVRLPVVRGPLPLADYLAAGPEGTLPALLLAPGSEIRLPEALLQLRGKADGVRILVGPEGGFTPAEREGAVALGAIPVTIGPRVLRSETAAVAAASLAAALLDR